MQKEQLLEMQTGALSPLRALGRQLHPHSPVVAAGAYSSRASLAQPPKNKEVSTHELQKDDKSYRLRLVFMGEGLTTLGTMLAPLCFGLVNPSHTLPLVLPPCTPRLA